MPRTKTFALWSLGTILLVPVAIVVFLAMAGDDFYRWAMRQAIEGRIDREVRAEGSFSFAIGLEPTVAVTDVWIENAPWAGKKEMARAKRVEIQIALVPLFSGIVRIPRLVVEGLDLDLETSAEGENNWEFDVVGRDDRHAAAPQDLVYPLFEFISLKDIAVTYRDHEDERDMELLLDSLHKRQRSQDTDFDIQGEGSLNRRTFQITGHFGSIQKALAATAPYPLELMLQSSSLVVDLAGTAQNLAAAEGFDMDLVVRTPAIGEVLKTFKIDLPLVGIAEASARLHGNLGSLAVEDIAIEVIERSGQELHAEGRFDDLMKGQGVDLRFAGKFGPDAARSMKDLPVALREVLADISQLDLMGRMAGDLSALAVKDMQLELAHASGAGLSLQGKAMLDLSQGGTTLTSFDATARLSLPDHLLLDQMLHRSLPNLGAIDGTAEVSWDGDWVTLRSAAAKMGALERLQLHAEGRIGKLSREQLAFELDPRIGFSAAIDHSRPLVYLVEQLIDNTGSATGPTKDPSVLPSPRQAAGSERDLVLLIQQGLKAAGLDPGWLDGKMGPRTRTAIERYQARHGLPVDGQATEELLRHLQGTADATEAQATPNLPPGPSRTSGLLEALPELGPVTAAVQLSHQDGAYRFDALNITSGAKGAPQIEVTGDLGAMRPESDLALENIALQVSFAVPSSQAFAQLLPPELPEFKEIRGSFDVKGTNEEVSVSNAQMMAKGPDGLVATVKGQVAKLRTTVEFPPKELVLDLDARWPDTQSVYRLVGQDLPELGPVWARATLRDLGETIGLTGIKVTVGSLDAPAARVAGEVGDLFAFKNVKLTGEIDVATTTFLEGTAESDTVGLGKVHGQFELSDTDGSIGLEALSAKVENTKLLSLSVTGLFDDIEHGDDLRMEATLAVPDLSKLGKEFGFEVQSLGSLSFKGEVSGSDEHFRAKGEARLGETDITGTLSGTLKGERPAMRAKLYSPLFRFADVGLVPHPDEAEPPSELQPKADADAPAPAMVFGETPIPFEALRQIDLDLDVLFDELEGVHLDIDSAQAALDIVDGVLRVDPFSLNFIGGRVDLMLQIDAKEETPKLHLALSADDVDLGDFLSQTEVEVPLDGELDLLVDLRATGQSPRALASSLEGEFDLAIERGRVRTSLLRLTTTNPVSWLFTESARKGYSDMNCLILRFDVQEGVAERETVLLDTPNVRAQGDGHVDLQHENIDIEFSPQAKRKRLIDMSTPFAIRGPLASPSVEVSAGGATARTAGEVLLSPINLLGSLLPFVSDGGTDNNNPCLVLQDGLSRQ